MNCAYRAGLDNELAKMQLMPKASDAARALTRHLLHGHVRFNSVSATSLQKTHADIKETFQFTLNA